MENLWWLYAIICSMVTAFYIYANQIFKLDSRIVMVYRTAILSAIFLLFVTFFEPITNPWFYVFCVAQGVVMYYIDSKVFMLSKNIGAEATGLFQPISIAFIFLVWMPISFYITGNIFNNFYLFLAEIILIAIIIYSIIKIKNAQHSYNVFFYVLPLILLATITDILNKLSMNNAGGNIASAVYYYNLITAFVASFFSIASYKKSKLKYNFLSSQSLFVGGIIIFLVTLLVISKNMAMFYTPNPTYVSSTLACSVLWIFILNRILKKLGKVENYQLIDAKYAVLLVFCVLGLIITSSYN